MRWEKIRQRALQRAKLFSLRISSCNSIRLLPSQRLLPSLTLQKAGICEKTGSGKSILLSTLLRLIDPTSGEVLVDNVNIANLPRNFVRENLVCLPQDPLLLSGTFRFNLDRQKKISDSKLIENVLKNVKMWDIVEAKGGLSANLALDSLSSGEQ